MKSAIWMGAAAAAWLVIPHVVAAKGGASCVPAQASQLIASTGLDADGTARARWQQDDHCRARFAVEVEKVPVGDYALLVGDVPRGSIAVRATASGGTEGEIEFEAGDDSAQQPGLDFDPRGLPVEIRLGTDVYFADLFTGSAAAGSPTPTRTAIPTAAGATPSPAATHAEDHGGTRTRTPESTRTRTTETPEATRTRTVEPTRTPTLAGAGNRGPGNVGSSVSGTARPTRTGTALPTRTRTPDQRGRGPEVEHRGTVGHH